LFNHYRLAAQIALLTGIASATFSCAGSDSDTTLKADNGKQWYKGNTHTHTLWSDGDAAPEYAVSWYKEQGYDFLSLTDHNVLSRGTKDISIKPDYKLSLERVEQLKKMFGAENVMVHTKDGKPVMRLRTLDQLQGQFEEPGKFLLIEGEEITGKTHVNGINLEKVLRASKSKNNIESMRQQVALVDEHSKQTGRPMFAHINHANWSAGISAEEIAAVTEARYFEIYNGHGGVKNWGDEKEGKAHMDTKWDIILTHRLSKNKNDVMYGVATDDTHNYFGKGSARPGRGWSMVLAVDLSPNSITEAFLRGDFYSSAGVTLDLISWNDTSYTVAAKPEAGVTYTTQFIGTRKGYDASSSTLTGPDGKPMTHRTKIYSKDIGEVLYETTDNPAVYTFKGDEIYVRAKIISSKPKSDPFKAGDPELAWTQPIVR
jgi:hypothetical protein